MLNEIQIQSIEPLGQRKVYDFEVEEDHGYVLANGIVTHNSPNQLNFPNDVRIKEAFVAPEGYKIGSADYDAQEVRQATNIAFDPDMKKVFTVKCESCGELQSEQVRQTVVRDVFKLLSPKTGEKTLEGYDIRVQDPKICCPACGKFTWSSPDPHSLNVQRIWPQEMGQLSLKEIKDNHGDKRNVAKMVQFQTLYGGSGMALADGLNISVEEATEIQKAFFRGAKKIEEAIERIKQGARETGYVETIGGYRRFLPDIQLKKSKWVEAPVLDETTKGYGCFGKVDHHPEINDSGNEVSLSKEVCPLGKNGDCKFFKECDDKFKSSYTNKLRARAERQAFNVQIQGDCADVTNRALFNIAFMRAKLARTNPEWRKLKIISNIYDAIYLLVPTSLIPDDPNNTPIERNYIEVLRWAMESTYPNMFVPLTAELEKPAANWSLCH